MTMHVMAHHDLTLNPSLQSVRFFLQTRFRCKVAPPSRHSLALRAHRHRLSAFARKKMSALTSTASPSPPAPPTQSRSPPPPPHSPGRYSPVYRVCRDSRCG